MFYNKVHGIVIVQQNDKELADNGYEHTNILCDKQQYWLRMLAVLKMFEFTFDRNKEGKKDFTPLQHNRGQDHEIQVIHISRRSPYTLHNGSTTILTISRGKSILPECLPEDADPAVQ